MADLRQVVFSQSVNFHGIPEALKLHYILCIRIFCGACFWRESNFIIKGKGIDSALHSPIRSIKNCLIFVTFDQHIRCSNVYYFARVFRIDFNSF